MFRKSLGICISVAFAVAFAAAAEEGGSRAKLSGAEIADKNVAARGGLSAWRAVQTMSLVGTLGAGGNQRATLSVPSPTEGHKLGPEIVPTRPVEEVHLPFTMLLKRPHKMRFELQFNGKTAVQVYDGINGWKLRPFLNRLVVEPYTADEMKIASMQADLDGPLVDYAAKGTRVDLAGKEKVERRDTYKLKLTLKNGQTIHVWIDAQTFLEAKIEGQSRRLDGTPHPVEVYFRDYRPVNGLQIPFLLETKVLPVAKNSLGIKDTDVPPEKIIVEKVVINPKIEESRFAKPDIVAASGDKSLAAAGRS
jgi:hypothetical protein